MLISTKVERFTASLASLLSISGDMLSFFDLNIDSIRFVWPIIPSVEIIHDARRAAHVWSELDVTLSFSEIYPPPRLSRGTQFINELQATRLRCRTVHTVWYTHQQNAKSSV